MIDFDVILEKVGDFGPYQIILYLSLCCFGIPAGMNAIAPVFLSYSPEYRCSVYPLDSSILYPNLTEEIVLNLTTPLNNKVEAKDACVRYGYNLTECTQANLSCVNKSESTIPCDQGYYYDRSLFTETVVTEFDLVCDQRVLKSVAGSAYMVGKFVGSIVFGITADRFGRKVTVLISCVGMLLSMLVTSFSNTVELYITCRFFVAVFNMGTALGVFVHIIEIVGVKWRSLVGATYHIAFAVGYMLWSGITYIWRDWHQMEWASLIITSPLLLVSIVAPESPRWLFATGKEKQGKKVTAVMARLNKTIIEENIWNEAVKSDEEKEGEDNKKAGSKTTDLFRYPGLRILSLKVGLSWALISMVYYGISLNAGALAGDIFLNNALAGVLEIASYAFCVLTMDYFGRRLLLAVTLAGSGVALFASTIVNKYAGDNRSLIILGVVFAFAAKALVSGSFAVIYNFTAELYPTVLRSNGVGFGSVNARFGGVLSPFIIGLQDYISWLPNIIFGVGAVISGLICLTLHDTTGLLMLETVEDAELFHGWKSVKGRKARMDEKHDHDNGTACISAEDKEVSTRFLSISV